MAPRIEIVSELDSPHGVDVHVGARIRMRRKELGLSQDGLAEALGVTFQQVQKYERGSNRVSASRLYQVARRMKVPIAYFFSGISQEVCEASDAEAIEQSVNSFLMTPEGFDIVRRFPKVPAPLRRRVLELVRTLAGVDG
jgi:transcriptional regulator with XRE-family HTH domain